MNRHLIYRRTAISVLSRGQLLLALAIACWTHVPGCAGDEELPPVFATTTVWERVLDSATAAVTVVDRQQIQALGAQTAADVLRFVPGVQVVGAGTRGSLSVAQIRGGDPNFTLVLIDGVPVNDGTYQVGGVFDLEGLPAAAVERIEIVRGPFSSYYGSTGLAGVIQIFTRQAHGRTGEAALAGGDGGFRAAEIGLSLADRSYVGVSYERQAEQVADESFESLHATGSSQWDLGETMHLRLAGRVADWEADDYSDASGGPVYGAGEVRHAEHAEQSLGLDLHGGRGPYRHKLTAAFYHHGLDRHTPAIGFYVPESTEETDFSRFRLSWYGTRQWGSRLSLSLGLDGEQEHGDNQSVLLLPDFLGGPVAGDYQLTRTTPGLAAELLYHRDKLTLELGSRLDWPESSASQWSPRLGLSYRPDPHWRFRAAGGRAFKLPSFFALASPRALGGNPELKPEATTGGDLGLEWHGVDERLELGLDAFHHRYRDLIDFDFEQFLHVNRSAVVADGVEGRFLYRARLWTLGSNLTYQDVVDEETDRVQRHQPRWRGALRLDGRPLPALTTHLELQRQSAQRDEQLTAPQRETVPAYTLVGVGGRWTTRGALHFELRVDNLLDEDYETLIGFPGPGRSFRLGLRKTWGDEEAR